MSAIDVAATAGAARVRDKAVDGVRQAAHLSHEARLLKSVASDALEDGVYKARRAWKRGSRELVDYRDEAAHLVRRQPFTAVGMAAAVGLVLGAGFFWLGRRIR